MKKILALLILILLGIQFIPVERTNPPIISNVPAPDNVKAIFKKACYDCHSNETSWVWYTKIAPMSFLASRDVIQGRKHLNFSEWDFKKDAKNKEEIWEVVREEIMPPWQYKIFHSESTLSIEEKDLIRNWTAK